MSAALRISVLLALACVLYCEATSPRTTDFESWKAFHGKSYPSKEEEASRKAKFEANRALVESHNEKVSQGKATSTMELNQYADQNLSEFAIRYGAIIPERSGNPHSRSARSTSHKVKRQTSGSFDWRSEGKVSPIKDQGQCGSCWSFSATGAMESQALINGQTGPDYSEEQLVDCSSNGNQGCGGGFYTEAWNYVEQVGGIESEQAYPYTAGNGQSGSCNFQSSEVVEGISTYVSAGNSEEEVAQNLQQIGPVSIAIRPVGSVLQHYQGGIYNCDEESCGMFSDCGGHAVLAVGYGSQNGQDYWIVKNSWGEGWGDQGYFLLARGVNACGMVNNDPSIPTVTNGGNSTG